MRDDFREIRYACTDHSNQSYIAQCMTKVYERCVVVNKSNTPPEPGHKKSVVHPKRVEIVQQKLTGSGKEQSIFADVARMAQKKFEAKIEDWKKNTFTVTVNTACQDILEYFNSSFVSAEAETEAEEMDQEHPEAVEMPQKQVGGEMAELIERWEHYEKYGC